VVTGAGSGIGKGIATGMARAGLQVAVVDIAGDNASATVEQIRSSGGVATAFTADVAQAAMVQRLIDDVTGAMGPLDVLVNSVGIFPRSAVVEMSEEEWDRVHATNLKSAFLLCRAVLPGMVERRRGRIVSVTSSLGLSGSATGAHYAASKAGLDALMRSLSAEVADDGVNVNNVAPGLTDTPMMRGANSPEYIQMLARRAPGSRLGQPADVVNLILFLCSEGAAHITGQVYNLR